MHYWIAHFQTKKYKLTNIWLWDRSITMKPLRKGDRASAPITIRREGITQYKVLSAIAKIYQGTLDPRACGIQNVIKIPPYLLVKDRPYRNLIFVRAYDWELLWQSRRTSHRMH